MGKTISKLRVFNENYIVPMVARAKAACPSPTAAENGAQGPPPSPNAADKVSDSTPESSPAGDGKALAEAPVSAQPTDAPSKLPAGKFEFKPTKGADDIEVLPVSGGWEASLDAGKETYKVGTDAKGEKIEFTSEYQLGNLSMPPINFTVRGIPCFAAGSVKVKVGTTGGAGSGKKSVKAFVNVVGRMTINAGRAQYKKYEVGIGGGGEAKLSLEVAAAETAEQLQVETNIPLKLAVFASARAKFSGAGGSYGPEIKKTLAQWTLGTITVNWSKAGSGKANLGSNPDVAALVAIFEQAMLAACNQVAGKVEDAVEKHAPQAVKDGAVDAAKWAAESEGAGKVADLVDKVAPDSYKDGAESVVKAVSGGDWETSAEATARVNEESRRFEDSHEDFHTCINSSGLNGELRPFRTSEEYNKIVDCWRAESEIIAKGRSAPGAWRAMIDELVQTARTRQKEKKAEEARKKAEEARKEKEKKEQEAAALQAAIDNAVKTMEAARTGAQGQGNVLNNRLKASASPNPNAKKQFDKGWTEWAGAESARNNVQSAQGRAKIQQAQNATAAYQKAKETWTNGIHQL